MNKADAPSSSPTPIGPSAVLKHLHVDCYRECVQKYTLDEHMATRMGARPHVCPVLTCAKRFSTSGNLSRHKRLHGYIEPLQCPIQGCVCAFPSSRKLEKHMKFHFSAEVKPCSVSGCGKTFSTTGNLNRHLKNHHGQLRVLENVNKALAGLVGSPMSGDQFVGAVGESATASIAGKFSRWEPMADGFLQHSQLDQMDDIWSPAVLDTLQIILGDESEWCSGVSVVDNAELTLHAFKDRRIRIDQHFTQSNNGSQQH